MNTATATYSPEDNKLRLYVGRVPRDEYEKLRADGWTSTPKQSCDFVATWTPQRRDTCLEYAELIEDGDQSPEDRAADRAERFGGYLDKRLNEATGHSDSFEATPTTHGYQSQARADRAANRHDRIAGKACDAWSKAEYWQRRTAGVIAHALYSSRPDVRMGRIKELEAELRKRQASLAEWGKTWRAWNKLAAMSDPAEQTRLVRHFTGSQSAGDYGFKHPRPETVKNAHIRDNGSCLWTLMSLVEREYGSDDITGAEACTMWLAKYPNEPRTESDWTTHLTLRLAYENQMLEAQGGRAAFVKMEVGGWVGNHQIRKVNKSNATGRVVSVGVMVPTHGRNKWGNPYPEGVTTPTHRLEIITVERMAADIYRAPSAVDKAALEAEKKAEKKAAPKVTTIPLINPTDEDAEKLQAIWNTIKAISYEREPAKVLRITQAQYSANSQGSYARAEAKFLSAGGKEPRSHYGKALESAICKVRFASYAVIIITDKPQKPLPTEIFNDPTEARLAIVQDQARELMVIDAMLRGSMKDTSALLTPEQRELFTLARLVGYAYWDSLSQRGTTPKFYEWARANGLLQSSTVNA